MKVLAPRRMGHAEMLRVGEFTLDLVIEMEVGKGDCRKERRSQQKIPKEVNSPGVCIALTGNADAEHLLRKTRNETITIEESEANRIGF